MHSHPSGRREPGAFRDLQEGLHRLSLDGFSGRDFHSGACEFVCAVTPGSLCCGWFSVHPQQDGLRDEGVTQGVARGHTRIRPAWTRCWELHGELHEDSERSQPGGLGDGSDLVDLEQEAVVCPQPWPPVRCPSGRSLPGRSPPPGCPPVSGTTSSLPSDCCCGETASRVQQSSAMWPRPLGG